MEQRYEIHEKALDAGNQIANSLRAQAGSKERYT